MVIFSLFGNSITKIVNWVYSEREKEKKEKTFKNSNGKRVLTETHCLGMIQKG